MMNYLLLLCGVVTFISASNTTDGGMAGGYILMERQGADGKPIGLAAMAKLADAAATLPINRIWVAFFSPTMVYKQGSNTLKNTGLHISNETDGGYAKLKAAITKLQAGGVEVFLSMGGWNYNCWPYMYTRYSVGGYGTSTPNYWKIQENCQGSIDKADESNQWCYTCEPQSEHTTLGSFSIFPEPKSDGYNKAMEYVKSKAGGHTPQFHQDMVPGSMYTDSKTGKSVKVPGTDYGERDPYQDIVYLAKDLGAAGIDLDYEEFWHADFFRTGKGPWELWQTSWKYGAICKNTMEYIKTLYPKCKLSTAAGAVGAWSGKWWGGNMKGVWLKVHQSLSEVSDFMSKGANAGGLNVMTYDLSSNEKYHECPEPGKCALDVQVKFYMDTYKQASMPANVGFEIGTPAYPDPKHDPSHQLPLSTDLLDKILSADSGTGGFFWEIFKPGDSHATPTQVAQAICKKYLNGASRCSGSFPSL
jgi:hypothetical protein